MSKKVTYKRNAEEAQKLWKEVCIFLDDLLLTPPNPYFNIKLDAPLYVFEQFPLTMKEAWICVHHYVTIRFANDTTK